MPAAAFDQAEDDQAADGAEPVSWSVDYAGATYQGEVRSSQQDAILADGTVAVADGASLAGHPQLAPDALLLLGVIDGMGGHLGGAHAAAIAATDLAAADPQHILNDPALELAEVSHRILRAGRVWGTPQMGCAAALLVLGPTGAVSLNVGDCRSYQVSAPAETPADASDQGAHRAAPPAAGLAQLSFDDRLPGPLAHVLTQCLGGPPRLLDVHRHRVEHLGRSPIRYLICSDGLHGALSPAIIGRAAAPGQSPAEAVQRLARLAEPLSQDNFSILVADVHFQTAAAG
ncbi:MAG: hypothetical protein LBS27_06045 [Bifidobacteriaceae bacterium]|jgi:serine/threonine protein phosphatase PrpC|nr:hypothetical protein [Bifidobacteriaceae bacterium]